MTSLCSMDSCRIALTLSVPGDDISSLREPCLSVCPRQRCSQTCLRQSPKIMGVTGRFGQVSVLHSWCHMRDTLCTWLHSNRFPLSPPTRLIWWLQFFLAERVHLLSTSCFVWSSSILHFSNVCYSNNYNPVEPVLTLLFKSLFWLSLSKHWTLFKTVTGR